MKAQNRNIIIEVAIENTKATKSGLVITQEDYNPKVVIGEVKNIAPDVKISVKIGDKIICTKYSGYELDLEFEDYSEKGKKIYSIRDTDIIAIL